MSSKEYQQTPISGRFGETPLPESVNFDGKIRISSLSGMFFDLSKYVFCRICDKLFSSKPVTCQKNGGD